MKPIYLDYAATTPCDPLVVEAMQPFFFEKFGNASSPHQFGRQARKAVEEVREALALALGAQPTEVVFTSGASEANNQAIFSTAYADQGKGKHIIASAMEHHSILEPLHRLETQGFQVTLIKPQPNGVLNPQDIAAAITGQTILVCVHHANNEIGTIQPVEEVGRLCKEKGIKFLVDATQTIGHVHVDVREIPCDFLSLSAHKFYGPQGVGALYIRKGVDLPSFILGGDQERGRRAATLNMPGIVGLGEALKIAILQMPEAAQREQALRGQVIEGVLKNVPGVILNGCGTSRLPNNAHFSFEKINGEEIVSALDMMGIGVSMGSACTWGQMQPSHVLKALGLSDEQAFGSLRVTVGRWTTEDDIDYFLEQLRIKIPQLRG